MKKNLVYQLENTPKVRKLLNSNEKLTTADMRRSFYISGNFENRTKSKFIIIFLHNVDKGYICYVANSEFGLGEFHWFSAKEITFILTLISEKGKTTLFNQWRQLWNHVEIIKEYIPLRVRINSLASEISHKENEYENLRLEIERKNKKLANLILLNKTI